MAFEISAADHFVQLVRETAQWCALRADPGDPQHSLRSAELATPTLMEIWWQYDDAQDSSALARAKRDTESNARFIQHLSALVQRRRELLAQLDPPEHIAGRLLFHDPWATDSTGGAARCSQRFFDRDDCPPWDTWICVVWAETDKPVQKQRPLLIAWIPEALSSTVQAGIKCSTARCTDWVDSPGEPFYNDIPILAALHQQWQEASQQDGSEESP